MVTQGTKFDLKTLLPRKLPAVIRRAEKLGLSQTQYVKRLIEDDLAREKRIRETPWKELAAPFREAFKGMTDDELDAMVEAGRRPAKRKRSVR